MSLLKRARNYWNKIKTSYKWAVNKESMKLINRSNR